MEFISTLVKTKNVKLDLNIFVAWWGGNWGL